jgi:hypothetical protein
MEMEDRSLPAKKKKELRRIGRPQEPVAAIAEGLQTREEGTTQ